MLENIKRLASSITVGLALTGCPESREISKQQAATKEALKCVVLCEDGNTAGNHSITYQCHPGISEAKRMNQAKKNANEVWQRLPQENKPECPSIRAFGLITE